MVRVKSGVVSKIIMISTQSKSLDSSSLLCQHRVMSAGRVVRQCSPRGVWDLSKTPVHNAYVLQQIFHQKRLSKSPLEGKEAAKGFFLNTSSHCYSCHSIHGFPFLPLRNLQEDIAAPWIFERQTSLDFCQWSPDTFHPPFWGQDAHGCSRSVSGLTTLVFLG